MDEMMTMEEARSVLWDVESRLDSVASSVSDGYAEGMQKQLRDYRRALSVITAHLAPPSQAVDVGAVKEVAIWLRTRSSETVSYRVGMDQASKLTRAIGNAQAEGWMPIETAPKDGTKILVFGEFAGEIGGPDGEIGVGVACWIFNGSTDYSGYHWRACNTDAYAGWWMATHWMPLPTPPTKATPNAHE